MNPIRYAAFPAKRKLKMSDCHIWLGVARSKKRGFAGDPPHLRKLIAGGIMHRGFSLIDVLQPCVTFNHVNTNDYYKPRVYKLEEDKGYDNENRIIAYERAWQWGDRIPIGLFYTEDRPTYEDEVATIKDMPLVKRPVADVDITKTMEQFM